MRHVESIILTVQKQNLGLGQITISARRDKDAVPKQALKQKRFHEHYCSDRHNGIGLGYYFNRWC